MKINLVTIFLGVAIAVITSCAPDEGNTPGADDRDPMVGTWTMSEHSKQFGTASYSITISKSSVDDEIIIKNFYNLGASSSTKASVSGASIAIESQQVSAQTITGSGTLSNSKINWSYTTDDTIQRDTCTATASK